MKYQKSQLHPFQNTISTTRHPPTYVYTRKTCNPFVQSSVLMKIVIIRISAVKNEENIESREIHEMGQRGSVQFLYPVLND